jgi:hypothetical protein
VDSGLTIPAIGTAPIHSFNGLIGGSAATSDALTATASRVSLKWSDPLGGSGNDYDLYILNAALTTVVDSSTNFQTGTQDPVELTTGPAFAGERVVVAKFSGQPRALRVDTHRGRLTLNTEGSTFGHNAGASTISVAATDVRTVVAGSPFTAPRPVESYSSDGPRKIFYRPNGTAITPGNVLFGTSGGQTLAKPDITAADCGATATPPPFNPFCGTSAAAPHAGAIAALLKSLPTHPSGGQVQTAMYTTAIDIEAAGADRDAGVGIVMANAAGSALANVPATNFFTVAPCRLVDTRLAPGPLGAPLLACGFDREFPVAGVCGIPASNVKALSVNATVTTTTGAGNLRLFAAGAPAPVASALNWSAGQTRGNNAIVPVSASGRLVASCSPSGTTNVIIDVNGYFQ